ncbi:oxidoreductase NAD-binding domain-containing protein 1 [Clupea harengus]|uniref:Oxidoreductase NAD-binding domain-containing protein 1 n=1 Tax=Clupea harengus TaxID=7950 RepID=A0A6P8H3Y0_CLUHA|nr:oxidoreductase NAD-binding domain-containing protein 1 [Clupea harengus]
MTIPGRADHLERTASNFRQMDIFPARVCGIIDESESVRRLRLEVSHPNFSFRAGQWVDFFIPGMEKVGGFSMCSAPGLLQREGVIELAVKNAQHPPAHWVHTTCALDSQVAVRVGGDFYFDPTPDNSPVDLLLVAGGVGINPLYSIFLHAADLLRHAHTHTSSQTFTPGHTHLLYSAKNTQDLLFKSTITAVCKEFPEKFSCYFNVTQPTGDIEQELQPYTRHGRISEAQLEQCVSERTLCFLCGPPPMIEGLSALLRSLGLSEDRIRYEKWW